ncbi:hypothetical protein [Acinetobacter venetianus]|uniref:hypothetical protein n=1 Tax=Acinetobacter venetianus TaxID=52133 RepID=UPI003A9301E6
MPKKTLAEVIEAVKSNEPLTDEELRMTVICLDMLMNFDFHAFMNLYKSEKESKTKRLVYSAIWQFENRFERLKRAMNQIPKIYVGENNDPKNPAYQKRRELSNKIVDKAFANHESSEKN